MLALEKFHGAIQSTLEEVFTMTYLTGIVSQCYWIKQKVFVRLMEG